MKIKLAFLFMLFAFASYAQTDSTEIKLNAYTKEDTVKVEMLIDACVGTTFKSDEKLLTWATQAHDMAERLNYTLGKIRAINCLGNYYYQRGLYDRSMELYVEALKIAESKNDLRNIIIGKSNVGNVLTHMKKLTEGIKLFKECDKLLIGGKDSVSQNRAAIITNLATAYSAAGKHDSAIFYYKKVYAICKKLSINLGLALTQSNLASEYFSVKNYNQALVSLAEADALTKKMHLTFLEAPVNKNYGKVYVALGNNQKGIYYLNQAAAIAQKNKDLSSLTDIYSNLYTAYAKSSDYKKAYGASQKFIQVNDSLFSIEKNKTVTELNTKYETKKKESQIILLQQEKTITELTSQRKSFLLYALATVLVLIGIVSYFLFMKYKYQKENQALAVKAAYEHDLNKSILTSIKAQMNPHFFYNALNTIQSYIFSDDKRNAITYLNKFSNLTRMILEMSEKESVPLAHEVKALTLYLELEKSRFQDHFSYSLIIDSSIDLEMVSIPAMLIQPYIENAIKHGLLHKQNDRELKINIHRDANILKVLIDDNGIGREQSAMINKQRIDKPQSFSSNANQIRLALLNNGRNQKVGVQFIDKTNAQLQAEGTTVIISIPLHSNE